MKKLNLLALFVLTCMILDGSDACRRARRVVCAISRPRFTSPSGCTSGSSHYLGPRYSYTHCVTQFWSTPKSNPRGARRAIGSRDSSFCNTGRHSVRYKAKKRWLCIFSWKYSARYCTVYFDLHVITCNNLPYPNHGTHNCPRDALVGTSCSYRCRSGYRLVGNSAQKCQRAGSNSASWSTPTPRCEEITCPYVAAPQDGRVSCTMRNLHGSICTFSCDGGYSLPDGSYIHISCSYNGAWSYHPVSSCIDVTSPVFSTCPGAVPTFYAPKGEITVYVNWTEPTASDNSGVSPNIIRSGHASGSNFPEGLHIIDYTARDGSGNQATCTFSRRVIVVRCNAIDVQPGIHQSCSHGNILGSVCKYTCAPGYKNVQLWQPTTPLFTTMNTGSSSTSTKAASHASSTQSSTIPNTMTTSSVTTAMTTMMTTLMTSGLVEATCKRRDGGNSLYGVWSAEAPTCEILHCPTLSPPSNGSFLYGPCPTTYGTECIFRCDAGYRTENNRLRCTVEPNSVNVYWEGKPPSCEVITCEKPSLDGKLKLFNGNSTCNKTMRIPIGETCKFQCTEGYNLVGSDTPECDINGLWTPGIPECQAITCLLSGLLVPPTGGVSGCSGMDAVFGTECTLYCNPGYSPSEPNPVRRTCGSDAGGNGVWNARPISCKWITCQPLSAPHNGLIESCITMNGSSADVSSEHDNGTVCLASCRKGYNATVSARRQCLEDRQWSGLNQSCIDVTKPLFINNPSYVEVFADDGVADAEIPWSLWEPIKASDAAVNITAHVVSIDGVPAAAGQNTLPEGNHTLVYEAIDDAGNTQTASFILSVKVTRCPPLIGPANGNLSLTAGAGSCEGTAIYGSDCEVTCRLGYEISMADSAEYDSLTLTCNRSTPDSATGFWSKTVPICTLVKCTVPLVHNGASIDCFGPTALYNEECLFTCNESFMSANATTTVSRRCQEDGTFSGRGLSCDVLITCQSESAPAMGTLSPEVCTRPEVPYNTTCSYSCSNSYTLYGPAEKRCIAHNAWTDSRMVSCLDDQSPTFDSACPMYINATADIGDTSATLDISAPTASDNSGNVTVKLTSVRPSPSNVYPEGETILRYAATDGAQNSEICEVRLTVLVYRCGILAVPEHGSLENSPVDPVVGSHTFFSCNVGYDLIGTATRTCELPEGQESAQWNGTQPFCKVVTCPARSAPPNSIKAGCLHEPPDREVFGTQCVFTCAYGYEASGHNSTICLEDGTWSTSNIICEATPCTPLNAPTHGTISPSICTLHPAFGQTCAITCDNQGYKLYPEDLELVSCYADGQWSHDNLDSTVCKDVERPIFTSCPTDFTQYAQRGEVQSYVLWNVSAMDNSKVEPTVTCDTPMGMHDEGTTRVTCTATDAAGNNQTCIFDINVKVHRCLTFTPPPVGFFVGPCHNFWGSSCALDCSPGYRLSGSSVVTCNVNAAGPLWNVSETPTCIATHCDGLTLPPGVLVHPPSCAWNVTIGVSCTPYCTDGFTIMGAYSDAVTCGENKRWSKVLNETSDISCVDVTRPRITSCPTTITLERTKLWGVEVDFPLPTASDAADDDLQVSTFPSDLTSPYNVTENITLSYTFTDDGGNVATCHIVVNVIDAIPPTIVFCPSDINGNNNGTADTCLEWDAPVFSTSNGDGLAVTCTYPSHQGCFPVGDHPVTCTATNIANGRQSTCSFTIRVRTIPCPSLRAPLNGALTCDKFTHGRFCSVHCNADYYEDRVSGGIPDRYYCLNSGMWDPHDTIPDCTRRRSDDRDGRLPAELYYTGTCGNDTTNQEIAQGFLDLFTQSPISEAYCSDLTDCTIENVVVTCGPGSSKRKKRMTLDQRRMGGRMPHQLPEYDWETFERSKRSTESFKIEFYISVKFVPVPGQDDYYTMLDIEDQLVNNMDALVASDTLILNVTSGGDPLQLESFSNDYIEVQCLLPGYYQDDYNYECVQCSRGSYLNNVTKDCVPCPIGTYQDEVAGTSCLPCPTGQSTRDEGARNITQCIDVCEPGSVGVKGTVPCVSCALGTYQPNSSENSCLSCSPGNTTQSIGSTSPHECIVPCRPGHVSSTGFEPCNECLVGTFQSQEKSTSCLECPGDTTTRQTGSTSASSCVGTYSCISSQCLNNATCLDISDISGRWTYECICQPGFEGVNCEYETNECSSNPCANGATCSDGVDQYQCICPNGFSGFYCDIDINECDVTPCGNGGTCANLVGDYQCICSSGYTGENCKVTIVDACASHPCEMGATCSPSLVSSSGFECLCPPGYTGVNCSTDIDDCRNGPCLNGGRCSDGINSFTCTCPTGFSGATCEIDVDLCAYITCLNHGTCVDLGTRAVCVCTGQFTGEFCSERRTSCDGDPCMNGGLCQVSNSSHLLYNCICPEGYIGYQCEIDFDDCGSNPCSNDGTCLDGIADFACVCSLGFEGKTCNETTNFCVGHPCARGSTCANSRTGFTCLCQQGFKGENCTEKIDVCKDEEPCLNGATCTGDNINYDCHCPNGYYGLQCENERDPCASTPCYNGGTCQKLSPVSYQCNCPAGFSGIECDIYNGCSASPCVYGTCTEEVNSFRCNCNYGYTGTLCDAEIDYCIGNRCKHGTCISLHSSRPYRCSCDPGYESTFCTRETDECRRRPCKNYGSCEDGINSYTCVCKAGFTGTNCETDIDECASDPCVNANNCISYRPGTLYCDCLPGFTGTFCEINIDDCQDHNCQNGATCFDGIDSYSCQCMVGYRGEYCQARTTPCDSDPCYNGAECSVEGDDTFSCTCLAGFEGSYCEIDTDECEDNACSIGSTCLDQVNGYTCLCSRGFSGRYCEQDVLDECAQNPCQNGATCLDGRANFTCVCPEGSTGRFCEIDIMECASNPCGVHGVCEEGLNKYTCTCTDGYSGLHCDHRPCDSSPCLNNATCRNGALQFRCICLPGFMGDTCEIAKPVNFDLSLDESMSLYTLAAETLHELQVLTTSFWMRAPLSGWSGRNIIKLNLAGLHYILTNPCALLLSIDGLEMSAGSSLCDSQWHHITFNTGLDDAVNTAHAQLYVDGILALGGDVEISPPAASTSLIAIIGDNTTIPTGQLLISSFNIWTGLLDNNVLRNIQSHCQPALYGDVISWTDVTADDVSNEVFVSPSLCDDTNECMSTYPPPCHNGGQCRDRLNTYECICQLNFTGADCQFHKCDFISCENGGTCDVINSTASCVCHVNFTGELCENPVVNGMWGEWSPWGPCSALCEGGIKTRYRECNNPAPNEFGLDCVGYNESESVCNEQECPGCLTLEPPKNGTLTCDYPAEDTFNCTIACKSGYTFTEAIYQFYDCGPETGYSWPHQGESNLIAVLPSCSEAKTPQKLETTVTVPYPDVECNSVQDQEALANSFNANLQNMSSDLGCTGGVNCTLNNVEVQNCPINGRRRRSSEPVTIMFTAMQDYTNVLHVESMENEIGGESVLPFDDVTATFLNLTEAGALDLEINGTKVHPDATSVNGFVNVSCEAGLIGFDGACAACPAGTYRGLVEDVDEESEVTEGCVPCPLGSYQDQEGQSTCLPCPTGLITLSLYSTDVIACRAGCPIGTYQDVYTNTVLCQPCPFGTYQDQEGQLFCRECPGDLDTVEENSTSVDDCVRLCDPGTFVDKTNASDPICLPCPVNTYKNESYHQDEECDPCPPGHATVHEGAITLSNCTEEFDDTTVVPSTIAKVYRQDSTLIIVALSVSIIVFILFLGSAIAYLKHSNKLMRRFSAKVEADIRMDQVDEEDEDNYDVEEEYIFGGD